MSFFESIKSKLRKSDERITEKLHIKTTEQLLAEMEKRLPEISGLAGQLIQELDKQSDDLYSHWLEVQKRFNGTREDIPNIESLRSLTDEQRDKLCSDVDSFFEWLQKLEKRRNDYQLIKALAQHCMLKRVEWVENMYDEALSEHGADVMRILKKFDAN